MHHPFKKRREWVRKTDHLAALFQLFSLTNLFLTLELFWWSDWNHAMRTMIWYLLSSIAVNHTATFFHAFNVSELNFNATGHIDNIYHHSIMKYYIYIYIYIYCNPQRDWFVISQLFSVARYVGGFKLGLKLA